MEIKTLENIIKFCSVNVIGLGYIAGYHSVIATGVGALGGYYIYKIKGFNSKRNKKSSILIYMEKEGRI